MGLSQEYSDAGYVHIKHFFDEQEISRMQAHCSRILDFWQRAEKATTADLINMSALTREEYFVGASEARIDFFNLIAHPKLVQTMDAIFDSTLQFHNTQLFFNPSDREQAPYWHRDLQFSPVPDAVQQAALPDMLSLHVRIALKSECGLYLIPGTHKRWDTPHEQAVRFERDGCNKNDDLLGATAIELGRGDILIFNAQMIHRGHYLSDESRLAFDLCIGKPHPLIAGSLDPSILPTQSELMKIERSDWFQRAREACDANDEY